MIEKSSRLNLFSRNTNIYSMTTFAIALFFGIIQPTTLLAVTSTYPVELKKTSPAFVRPNNTQDDYYFYQALQFNTSIAGQYTFKSSSSSYMSTFGCLYHISFDPSNSANNLVICDEGSGGYYQFLFTSTLQTGQTYILVVTTSEELATGDYTAIADGPGSIVLTPVLPAISNFDGTLSTSSGTFKAPFSYGSGNYYYQALHITNNKRGVYTFRSESPDTPYGYLYNGSFYPNDPKTNLVVLDEASAGVGEFLIVYLLETNVKYVLVYGVQLADNTPTSNFTIISTGPTAVTLVPYTPTLSFGDTDILGIVYTCIVCGVVLLSILTHRRRKK